MELDAFALNRVKSLMDTYNKQFQVCVFVFFSLPSFFRSRGGSGRKPAHSLCASDHRAPRVFPVLFFITRAATSCSVRTSARVAFHFVIPTHLLSPAWTDFFFFHSNTHTPIIACRKILTSVEHLSIIHLLASFPHASRCIRRLRCTSCNMRQPAGMR